MSIKKLSILLLLFSLFPFGCDQRVEYDPVEAANYENFDRGSAQAWFETNATDLAPLSFSDSVCTRASGLELVPKWADAMESGFDGLRVVEIPLWSNSVSISFENVMENGRLAFQKFFIAHRRLVVARRSTGETSMFVITIMPLATSDGNIEKSMKNFRYLGGGDFTGRVFCSTLDGQFVKAFGYHDGQPEGRLTVRRRSGIADKALQAYSEVGFHEEVQTRADPYKTDEVQCPHGNWGPCSFCMDPVIVVSCPICKLTNDCICARCLKCNEKPGRCTCVCPDCKNKVCTCELCSYCAQRPGKCTCIVCSYCRQLMRNCTCGSGIPNPWPEGGGSGGSGGGGVVGGGGGSDIAKPTGGILSPGSITSAAEKAAKAMLTKYGLGPAACNYGVQTAFNGLYSSGELNGKKANMMIDHWKNNPSKWTPIKMSEAQGLANEGWFVVAGWQVLNGSGHVVVIVPGTEVSGWGGEVPVCMDTGRNMKTSKQGLNYSFSSKKKDKIVYYKYE